MSKPKKDNSGKGRQPEAARNVGVHAELPMGARDALFELAEVTRTPASHHVRLAVFRYLKSSDIIAQMEEAKRFSEFWQDGEAEEGAI